MLCRAGLSHRLVKLPLTLCLMCISPHALCENVIKDYKESEPQKLPTPICPLLSLNVLGHLWAYLNYYMVDPVKICLSPSVKGAFTTVAKEQPLGELAPLSEPLSDFVPLYELNKKKSYPTTKMLFWQEVHTSPDGSDDQDEGDDADKVTFKPKLMHRVFKPFFPVSEKSLEMVFRGFAVCFLNDNMPTKRGPEEC